MNFPALFILKGKWPFSGRGQIVAGGLIRLHRLSGQHNVFPQQIH